VKIVLQYYAGTRSLYIQEGRQDKGRKTAPRAGARGLSHVRTPPHLRPPPLVSHVRTPPHLRTPPYSDTSTKSSAPADGLAGRWHKAARRTGLAARVAVGVIYALVLVCAGVDSYRFLFSSAIWVRAHRAAADSFVWLKKRPGLAFATLWRWAAWLYWLGGGLWRDLKLYFRWLQSIHLAGRYSVDWLSFWRRFDSETAVRELNYPLSGTLFYMGNVLRSVILRKPIPSAPDREYYT